MTSKEIDYFTVENDSVGDPQEVYGRFEAKRRIRRKSTSRCSLYVFICFLLAIIAYLILAPMLINTTKCNQDDSGPMSEMSFEMLKALCPHIRESEVCQYRFDLSTSKCYLAGDKGPCSANMRFFLKEDGDSPFGQCECDFDSHVRRLILDQKGDNCYFVFEQGFCAEGQWLNIDSNSSEPRLICENTLCIEKKEETQVPLEVIDKNGLSHQACVVLGESSDFCRDKENPNASFVVDFTHESLYAKCVPDGPKAELSMVWNRGKPRIRCVRRPVDRKCIAGTEKR